MRYLRHSTALKSSQAEAKKNYVQARLINIGHADEANKQSLTLE